MANVRGVHTSDYVFVKPYDELVAAMTGQPLGTLVPARILWIDHKKMEIGVQYPWGGGDSLELDQVTVSDKAKARYMLWMLTEMK